MPRPTTTAATILTVALLFSGCDKDQPTPPPFTPTPGPTLPTKATTATPPPESAAVVAAYRRYRAAIAAMTASGGKNVKDLSQVATGVELRASLLQAENYRARKLRTIGTTELLWVRATKVSPAVGSQPGAASVEACYDTSKAKAVDASGKVIRVPGTPTRWRDRRELRFVDGGWKVENGRNEGAQC